LNVSLKYRILIASISVTEFVKIIGKSDIRIPYVSQSTTPVQKIRYMPSDKSFADFDRHVFTACGRKATVVQKPAASPITVK
jgi:hypothetical protein